jgi:hypothetical protein
VADAQRIQTVFRRLLPWVSLGTGIWSAFFQTRTWEEVHWIGWVLAGTWASAVALGWLETRWRTHGETRRARILRFGLDLASQNGSQEVLFFVLPFWIRSTTFLSPNGPFTILLIALGAITVIDPIYLDRILRHPFRRILFKSILLFAGLDFLLVALTPFPTVECALMAGATSGAIGGLGLASGRARGLIWGGLAGLALAGLLRNALAPVPLHLVDPVLCSGVRDHQPLDTLETVGQGSEAWFWTPVFAPPGRTDSVRHVWTFEDRQVASILLPLRGGRERGFRTWSSSRQVTHRPGSAHVEVRLLDGQLLGRRTFDVRPR